MSSEDLIADGADVTVAVVELLPRVDTEYERGWVEGVGVWSRDVGHGSMVGDRRFP